MSYEYKLLAGLVLVFLWLCIGIYFYRKARKASNQEDLSACCPHCGERLTAEEVLDLQIGLQ
ncbi:hypothetical protein K2P47_01700 [Patescibacteria group bacterium]|nr:hypothetical protein [Patescibacteria group bacterium]